MNEGVALYYPRISIGSVEWLKSTLLLWDSVRRIVPAGAVEHDALGVSAFVEHDLLRNTSPFEYTDRAEQIFFDKLSTRDTDGITLEEALQAKVAGPHHHAFTAAEQIHVEKVSHGVMHRLSEKGLMVKEEGGWLRFDPRVGALYMCSLASAMGMSMNAPLITDETPYLGWAHLFAASPPIGPLPSSDALIPVLAGLRIEWPFPSELTPVAIPAFLRFHERHSAERRAFREAIEGIANDLSQIEDTNQLEDAVAMHRKNIETRLRDLRKTQTELGIKSLASALSINCPTLITAAVTTSMIGPTAGAVIAGCGVALSAAAWAAELRGAARGLHSSDALYYALRVRSRFLS